MTFALNFTSNTMVAPPYWVYQFVIFLGAASIVIFFYLFPTGRFVPRWTRWLSIGAILFWGLKYFLPSFPFNPYNNILFVIIGFLATVGAIIIAQVYRYLLLSNSVQRQQTKWVVFGVSIAIGGDIVLGLISTIFFPWVSQSPLADILFNTTIYLLLLLIPISLAFAILRSRLWDIDIIINRTLVYGILTASVVAIYVLVVGSLGTLLQATGNLLISLVATGLVAVLFSPLRQRLQHVVNRLMYGDRDDPYRVISRLGQRLEATLASDAVLPTIVETAAQALKLPYAAISLRWGEELLTAASYGSPRGELVRLPLVSQNEAVGELVLAPRAPGESFTPADRALLSDLARQAGIAAHAVRLTADLKRLTIDLQRSRERLVTAREEERRRLRRDLHDGLGPQLASLTLKLETARNRLAHDPLADTLLSDLAERTQATVADIRRLVYALRPPALDELGLSSALRELTLQSSDQVVMHLDAPDCLPELPAAVEVAVYRITQEALTNVVRHAAARRCDMRLALDEAAGLLTLTIRDDGCGLSPARPMGVGMTSMRERAEELGGTWTIEQVPTGGTRVLARLPYAGAETGDEVVVTSTVVSQEEE
jgi:signal transduction histidine kinase